MKLSIGKKLFLALTLASILILAINAAVTRWNFERGFLEYVAASEGERLAGITEALAEFYRSNGSWNSLSERDTWRRVVQGGMGQRGPSRAAPPGPRPRDRGDRPPPPGRGVPPPPPDLLDLDKRLTLLDAGGSPVAGEQRVANDALRMPILVSGTEAGYLLVAPPRALSGALDKDFAARQTRMIWISSLLSLLLAGLIALVMSKMLVRPLRSLAAGANAIGAGDYTYRVAVERRDELGELADDFNRLARDLQHSSESRKRWVADIAHELRTPLSVLKAELEAVDDGVREFSTDTLRSLQAEVERLASIVNDLRELAESDQGGLSYRRERLDIAKVLRESVASYRQRAADTGLGLQISGAEAQTFVIADPKRLDQLFTNLLENAFRYTDVPGSITVSISSEQSAAIINFEDSAPGVPEQSVPRLFDRLYRVESSRNRNTGGSGLGLSICKAIVDGHQGNIEASASSLGGLRVRIELPLADGRA